MIQVYNYFGPKYIPMDLHFSFHYEENSFLYNSEVTLWFA